MKRIQWSGLYLLLFGLIACVSMYCQKKEHVEAPVDVYWQLDEPINQGFQPDSVRRVLETAGTLRNFYALLVIRNNRLVVEEYFNGKGAHDLLHLRSITKNFTSALTNLAIQQGMIDSLDEPIQRDFPSLIDGAKSKITFRHLLNMSSGLTWDEDAEVIPLIEHQIRMPVSVLLARPLENDPGLVFNYNSVSPHIVSNIIATRSQMTFERFAQTNIFDPLGIDEYAWTRGSEGNVWGGFGLQLRPLDLAKLGQLYLQEGIWNEQQLIDRDWVQLSQTIQMETASGNSGYSLQWWISKNFASPLFFGNGYGGQGLMILPEKNMIVVGMHEYLVTPEQNNQQWANFVNQIFRPLFDALLD